MSRRRRGGLIDAAGGSDTGDDIEILDLDAARQPLDHEVIEVDPSGSRSGGAALAAVLVGGLAMLGVITTGNTPAPEPPAPSITVPPDPAALEEAEREAEVAELEATYGVEIGDGPGLVWDLVVWNIDTNQFQWIDDGFVGQNGETEWTIRPGVLGPSIGQRQSLELEFPGYSMQLVDGARLLVPEGDAPDHLLAVIGDREPIRFEFPPLDFVPSTDLVNVKRSWFSGVVVDDQLVLTGFQAIDVNREALSARTGRDLVGVDWFELSGDQLRLNEVGPGGDSYGDPIIFDDVGFTEDELADLRLLESWKGETFSLNTVTGSIAPVPLDLADVGSQALRTATGIALLWSDEDLQTWLSSSTDGVTWSTVPFENNGRLSISGSTLYSFPFDGSTMRRSSDAGRTWQRTRTPFGARFNSLAIDDILIIVDDPGTGPTDDAATVQINTDDYDLTITGAGRTFELTDPTTGDSILSGSIDDSASGIAFDPFGNGLALSDPVSGEELLSIPQGALLQAYAQAQQWRTPDVAFSKWDPAADDPEWSIQPINALFPNAIRVEFVAGDEYLLAIATTARGYDYYVARTTEAS